MAINNKITIDIPHDKIQTAVIHSANVRGDENKFTNLSKIVTDIQTTSY